MEIRNAKFCIGDVVSHRSLPLRGVVLDVDPVFSRTEEWYRSLPLELRPDKNQPFYTLVAENDEGSYLAYIAESNIENDRSGEPLSNPRLEEMFQTNETGHFTPRHAVAH
ncbi:heat shock protein HspQ [Martelella sp. HB161492]|uniref:heat shock protein HspQ n=1 Tax=Martelella sp. HB161492 TaxID=2720726 RepID=UPI001591F7E6|nr:heat shock protein HspQ [Martelella sp. HB161492]